MRVLIGVDPHKSVNAVAAIDENNGELIAHETFPADREGLRALEQAFPKATLGGGRRRRHRQTRGSKARGGRRGGGGRTTQTFGEGEGTLGPSPSLDYLVL